MFLKPKVTKDFASRVGHHFAMGYTARLDAGVNESLLDLDLLAPAVWHCAAGPPPPASPF